MHLAVEEEDGDAIYQRISSGSRMHYPRTLGAILKDQGRPIPLALTQKYRRFGWTTDLRYATRKRPGGEAKAFLKMVRSFYRWVEGELS